MTSKLTAADIQLCGARLSVRQAALRTALASRSASEGESEGPRPVEVHDLKDDAFAALIADLSSTALAHVHAEWAAVQTALQRISDGTFGRCVECNLDISRERLLAQPSAERCLPCQERRERLAAPHSEPNGHGRPLKDGAPPRR